MLASELCYDLVLLAQWLGERGGKQPQQEE
jgi:hypothetical protein